MNLDEVLHHRRSVRVYDKEKPIDTEKVKHCLELATLAPNSSDMQLWEFYHITEPELLAKISRDSLGQKAASTASQIVIFVVRRDWYKKHARFVLNFERENIRHYSPKERQAKRIKDREIYYGILMPFVYARFFGILGLLRKLLANIISIFRPMMLEVSENDIRVTAHKSCALAAQTFMIAMANETRDCLRKLRLLQDRSEPCQGNVKLKQNRFFYQQGRTFMRISNRKVAVFISIWKH